MCSERRATSHSEPSFSTTATWRHCRGHACRCDPTLHDMQGTLKMILGLSTSAQCNIIYSWCNGEKAQLQCG